VSTALAFGVEEELLTVDPASRAVVPKAADVLARTGLGDRAAAEFTRMQVELRTTPCHEPSELLDQLCEGRSALAAAAAAGGVGLVASASPVLGSVAPAAITDGSRQRRGDSTFRALHDEVTTCAAHVHVEVRDRERAVLVSNHLRPYLPVLIALCANSPYWCGRDTGYASWRTISWQRWPVAGAPPFFTSAEHYEQTVTRLLDAGALVDRGTIFWDVRPSDRVPTIEIRVADVPVTARATALLAILVRALVARALEAVDNGDPGPDVPAEMLRAAYWRAARDGLVGYGIDLRSGALVRATDQVTRLVDELAPALGADLGPAREGLGDLLATGNGAIRQRRAAAGGDLADVVDHLLEAVSTRAHVTMGPAG